MQEVLINLIEETTNSKIVEEDQMAVEEDLCIIIDEEAMGATMVHQAIMVDQAIINIQHLAMTTT